MMFLLIVTATSVLLAVVMSVIAWRIAREEGRRSEARIASLAAEIHAAPGAALAERTGDAGVARRAEIRTSDGTGRLTSAPSPIGTVDRWDELEMRPAVTAVPNAGPFAGAQSPRAGSQWALVFGIGALALASAAALAIVPGAGSRSGPHEDRPAPVGASAAVPLELVALGHERDGDRLTVHGVVRNPAGGARIDRVAAVVFVFDRDGGFLASGRMPVQSSTLPPGGETAFAVTVPGASEVGRYRVSFRTDDRIVPHVDRRQSAQVKS
jgi:hypothetical protein